MDRRNFIKIGGAFAGGLGLGNLLHAQQMPAMQQGQAQNSGAPTTPADFTVKIGTVLVELGALPIAQHQSDTTELRPAR